MLEGLWILAAGVNGADGWIDDFGIVVAAAGIAVVIFRLLRFPVIFGYMLAGLLIGPHLLPNPVVEDIDSIQQISELGVIFLLFFIGMEFDLRRLRQVLGPALLGVFFQTLGMLYLAKLCAGFFGWDAVSTLFFGSLLAISSSMVTVRVLRDSGKIHSAPAQYAIGLLIMEDILAVTLLVVLTGVAVTRSFAWEQALLLTGLMAVFTVGVFVVGRSFLPKLLARFTGGDAEADAEIITLSSVGLVMGISVLALKLEFSPALGAFIAGTLLSQTQVARTVEHVNRSLHDTFSAVFFVSVGMQMQPTLILENSGWVLLLAALLILGKIMTCWLGLFLAGQSGRMAFLAAVPKSQIGEFSFIIASLGTGLGVMDARTSGIAFGVAFVTILLTPLLTGRAEQLYGGIERLVPNRVARLFNLYHEILEALFRGLGASIALRLIRRPLMQIGLYMVLVIGFLIVYSIFGRNLIALMEGYVTGRWVNLLFFMLEGLLLLPFLLAIIRNLNATGQILAEALVPGHAGARYRGRLRQLLSVVLTGISLLVIGLIFLYFAGELLPSSFGILISFTALGLIGYFLQRQLIRVNNRMELLFMDSFGQEVRDRAMERRSEVYAQIKARAPWPVELGELTLPERAQCAGLRIHELRLRERFGVNVVAMGRGDRVVFDPVPNAPVFGGDRLVLFGGQSDIAAAQAELCAQRTDNAAVADWRTQFGMEEIVVEGGEISGQTLAGAQIRRRFGITVVGLQHKDTQTLTPSADSLVQVGDILLVAGQPERLGAFRAACGLVDRACAEGTTAGKDGA